MTSESPTAESGTNAALVERLRGEIASVDATAAGGQEATKAYLWHEVGVLHEVGGEEPVAARDYLAAYNADAEFREPLEALVRVLSRRRSFKNLGKLLDAMAKGAPTAEERARALRELAVVALEHDKNKDEAKARLEEAVAENPDETAAWLELEMLAAEADDIPNVMRAIEARLPLVTDGTYKALLYIQLAEYAAKAGQHQRAYEFLDAAAALEGRARFQTRLVLERIAQSAADLEALARALEGQAELVAEVLDDPDRGEEIGVPRFMRTPAFVADALLRAAEIKRRSSELEGASALLAHAARRLPESSVVARARLSTLELQGDLDSAAAVAQMEISRGASGANAAALWLRVAEASAAANDRTAALDALRHALDADSGSIPARAIEIDLLVDATDPAALAGAVEGAATTFSTDAARARAFVLAAYVWACFAKEAEAAQAALTRAAAAGVEVVAIVRLTRLFAAIAGDESSLEAATEQLLASGAEPHELSDLCFDLARSRLLRGDAKGAEAAFAKLAGTEGLGAFGKSPWLGRILGATVAGLASAARPEGEARPPRSPEPMDALAASESDPALARGLGVVAALRAAQSGDVDGARSRLTQLADAAPGDEIISIFLAEVSSSDPRAAAAVLSRCAGMTEDAELGAAMRLESALYSWRAGDRAQAVAEIEAIRDVVPGAAAALLGWARRGLDPSSLEGRRAAASVQGADPSVGAIERFGLELGFLDAGGDAEEALAALEIAEHAPPDGVRDDLATAAALGRLLLPGAADNRDAAMTATDRLESRGGDAAILAAAERFRIARDVDQDPRAAAAGARAWAGIEPQPHVALEWLSAAMAGEDRASEIDARNALAAMLDGAAGEAMRASAAIVGIFERPGDLPQLIQAEHAPGRLVNLELAPPGCDPRRRAAALHGIVDSLGGDAYVDALLLAGYSDLVSGEAESALDAFKAVVDQRPSDMGAWEGVRAAAEMLDNPVEIAMACAQLGALSKDDARGGAFWEMAGLILLERTDAHEDAEIALDRAFTRNPHAEKAFDKLFRRVRARKDDDRLLDLIGRRLEVADDEREIGKLFWERARVLQKRGDADGALAALENVTMLEPDHVGALALSGTICIQKGDFAGAAGFMARLSQNAEAPKQERLVSGITACDLYENKLNQPEKALEVLVGLHKEGLSTAPV
ncbi:MAG TPA: hypothetical protein VL400_14670, partial [Polyangiaceae bacterium]|nr:hypothetical protein [Polyangiaceae bacterium]